MKNLLIIFVISLVCLNSNQANSKEVKYEEYTLTFYCACSKCCSPKYADGITASGEPATLGCLASDNRTPFGAVFCFTRPILGRTEFVVKDRFGKEMPKNRFDVFVPEEYGGHKTALKLGIMKVKGYRK